MQLIPAIDVLEGKVVRLAKGDFDRVTTFGDDPCAVAKAYEQAGANTLHVVNLSSAKNPEDRKSSDEFLALLRRIASETRLVLQAGGGIRSRKEMEKLFDAGAACLVLGTTLFRDPKTVAEATLRFGPEKFIAALDVRSGVVQTHGWTEATELRLPEAIEKVGLLGISRILVTDIDRDGMQTGPNLPLYAGIKNMTNAMTLIASGGVRSVDDCRALAAIGCEKVVLGRALLDGTVPHEALKLNIEKSATSSTLAVRVIPCLDVKDGRVVKGRSFQQLRDAGDPVDLAKRYCTEGADELVFLDITATSEGRRTVFDLAARVAEAVNIPFTIGGGIRSVDDARSLLDAGADKISINSAAVKNPALLSEVSADLGSANTVCAIDAKRKGSSWVVLTRGGRDDTGIDAVEWAEKSQKSGAGELLVTSYDRDGIGQGFDIDLLSAIKNIVKIPVIASGGGGTLNSFVDAVRLGKADAVLAASVFHFGTFSIGEVKAALRDASIHVRLQ